MMFIVTILIACVTPQDKTEAEKIWKKLMLCFNVGRRALLGPANLA